MKGISIVCGIDTDIGKTFITGRLYREMLNAGLRVMTHKLIQTGCVDISEDIEAHRNAAGLDLLPQDLKGESCPYLFSTPCSPHLAAHQEGVAIDPDVILNSMNHLASSFDYLLAESAGGLLVPLTPDVLTADLIAKWGFPVILVSSPRLGSINHTLLSLEALKSRGIVLSSLIHNCYGDYNKVIAADSQQIFKKYLFNHFPSASLLRYDEALDSFISE